MSSCVKVAAIHAASVFLDRKKSTEKAIGLIREAARSGAELIAFPESFIPGFPVWAALWPPIDNHDLFAAMARESVLVDGPEMNMLRAEARELGVFLSVGFSEKSPVSVGGLWNANVLIGDDGSILTHHRKIVPTFYEKLIWASGDGAGLAVADTRLGKIGALICGENANPLARFALMAGGEQIHISNWPPIWPTRRPKGGGNFNNVNANRIRTAAHSFEAKAFGIACAGFMDAKMRAFLLERDPAIGDVIDGTPRAASFFVAPTGEPTGETAQDEEAIVYAEFDLEDCVEPKQFHDVVGYYNRFDIFDLRINRTRLVPMKTAGASDPDFVPVDPDFDEPQAHPRTTEGLR
ncbi:carbon-nitrogen hydrolase family protein [Rhodobium gokarnense]|uniref:Aliphatic nitrilase n=1 Tax=Rhodobium gokarnense TaxID=364296 RepID=A0ABT3H947_9HYPH|nr:carbon-nitrogen hydrolase family protein [Rhodobium gokarnense]MCW2306893.1 aliphatic nitrilase [Rhodobium gokarnense]